MLLEFIFSNYRSFRDETTLSMEAVGLSEFKSSLISFKRGKYLPLAAIYGKNGAGKSNVIRAMWLGIQFIKNAQRTQHESAQVPMQPFMLDDTSRLTPSKFEYRYTLNGVEYKYGFSATKTEIVSEYLSHAPNGKMASIFSRDGQQFTFPENNDKRKKLLISEAVAPNQLFFAVACTMNYSPCTIAMQWFREYVLFSRDFRDIPEQLIEYAGDTNMLQAIVSYAKSADIGIQEMEFEVKSKELDNSLPLESDMPEELKHALGAFMQALSDAPNVAEQKLQMGELKAISYHKGINSDGIASSYTLGLADESDGTRKLMSLAPSIEKVLSCGGVLVVDELEKAIHPILMEYIISKFQAPSSNKHGAQLIFTTHNTEPLSMTQLRKDQIYFADKSREDGSSELYSVSACSVHTKENIRKGYLAGKYGAIPDIEIEEVE